ncbi:hypothetical protein EBI01_17520 [Marinomonas rhizomae]|nr:hypothetical protein EBI01_17520 [Marinomonas rhizomae]
MKTSYERVINHKIKKQHTYQHVYTYKSNVKWPLSLRIKVNLFLFLNTNSENIAQNKRNIKYFALLWIKRKL